MLACKLPKSPEVPVAIAHTLKTRVTPSVFLPALREWLTRFIEEQPCATQSRRAPSSGLRFRWRLIVVLSSLLCGVGLVGQNSEVLDSHATSYPDKASATPATVTGEVSLAVTLDGKVKSGNTPVPGATVGATNPATGQKVVGWTRADGSYELALPADGEYVVRIQMAGFAVTSQHVNVSATNPHPRLDLQITLLSRAQNAAAGAFARGGGAALRGFQTLSVMAAEAGAGNGSAENNDSVAPSGMPVPGIPPSMATESVAVSGSSASGNIFSMSSDEMRARIQEYRNQQGMQGGPGGPGGPGGGPGGLGAEDSVALRAAAQ